ncbi:hypothetical protein AOLI_G00073420 [Acnodon oligacanthus]
MDWDAVDMVVKVMGERGSSEGVCYFIDEPARSTSPAAWLMGVLRINRQELRKAERREKVETSASNPRKLFSIFSSLLNPPPPPPPSSLTPEDFVTFFEEKMLSFN